MNEDVVSSFKKSTMKEGRQDWERKESEQCEKCKNRDVGKCPREGIISSTTGVYSFTDVQVKT